MDGLLKIPCKYDEQSNDPKHYGNFTVDNKRMMLYSVYFNYSMEETAFFKSLLEPAPVDDILIKVKTSIDNAIMKYLGELKGLESEEIPYIELTHSSYPIVADRLMKD